MCSFSSRESLQVQTVCCSRSLYNGVFFLPFGRWGWGWGGVGWGGGGLSMSTNSFTIFTYIKYLSLCYIGSPRGFVVTKVNQKCPQSVPDMKIDVLTGCSLSRKTNNCALGGIYYTFTGSSFLLLCAFHCLIGVRLLVCSADDQLTKQFHYCPLLLFVQTFLLTFAPDRG